jgi:hypothetical protein
MEKERVREKCSEFVGWGDDKHRKALIEGDSDEDKQECNKLMMDSPGYVKLLKEKWGVKVS